MGCYQHLRWYYHHTELRYWILIHSFLCLDGEVWGSVAKVSPCGLLRTLLSFMCDGPTSAPPHTVPQARVVTVPAHAARFNEDRRGRWLRVNYSLMLESNTISPFITPQRHGLTGAHQLVKGTHVEQVSPVWNTRRKREVTGGFFSCQINARQGVMSPTRIAMLLFYTARQLTYIYICTDLKIK